MSKTADTVWVRRSANHTACYHLSQDCPQLPESESQYRPVARDKLNGSFNLCKDCDPDYDRDCESVGTIHCPQCGDEVSANGLRSHLPCGGDADA